MSQVDGPGLPMHVHMFRQVHGNMTYVLQARVDAGYALSIEEYRHPPLLTL